MKKEWQRPVVETLDIAETMLGTGMSNIDFSYSDEDETVFLHSS
ncbi:paeninodin family lasso peptide [Phosphitispora fastidiosa]|nr:paeninodin family lasso peptide [Phosphitispora fastidiosa]MBU7007232.1 hypothetical protein [Phosphitispora fastidiosa]